MRAMVILAGLVALTSCSSGDSSTSRAGATDAVGQATTTTAFPRMLTEGGLTFTIPDELTFRSDGFASSAESVDDYYSNFEVRDGCTPNGCGAPVPSSSGGIVISFGVLSGFGVGIAPDVAPNASIAGRDAVVTHEQPGACGGDETITAWIPNADGFNVPMIRACLRGPDLESGERIVQAVLDSAT